MVWLTAMAHHLCVHDVDSAEVMAFVTCQLIPLDKKPGVHPIGIGDIPQRIIAKAISHVIGNDIFINWQLGPFRHVLVNMLVYSCYKSHFVDNNTHAAFCVDATNAFYLVNCQASL